VRIAIAGIEPVARIAAGPGPLSQNGRGEVTDVRADGLGIGTAKCALVGLLRRRIEERRLECTEPLYGDALLRELGRIQCIGLACADDLRDLACADSPPIRPEEMRSSRLSSVIGPKRMCSMRPHAVTSPSNARSMPRRCSFVRRAQ
jgi:hypothetical protein